MRDDILFIRGLTYGASETPISVRVQIRESSIETTIEFRDGSFKLTNPDIEVTNDEVRTLRNGESVSRHYPTIDFTIYPNGNGVDAAITSPASVSEDESQTMFEKVTTFWTRDAPMFDVSYEHFERDTTDKLYNLLQFPTGGDYHLKGRNSSMFRSSDDLHIRALPPPPHVSEEKLLDDVIVKYNDCNFFNRGNECKHPLPQGDTFDQLFACLVWEVDSTNGFTTYSSTKVGSESMEGSRKMYQFIDADREQRAIYLSDADRETILRNPFRIYLKYTTEKDGEESNTVMSVARNRITLPHTWGRDEKTCNETWLYRNQTFFCSSYDFTRLVPYHPILSYTSSDDDLDQHREIIDTAVKKIDDVELLGNPIEQGDDMYLQYLKFERDDVRDTLVELENALLNENIDAYVSQTQCMINIERGTTRCTFRTKRKQDIEMAKRFIALLPEGTTTIQSTEDEFILETSTFQEMLMVQERVTSLFDHLSDKDRWVSSHRAYVIPSSVPKYVNDDAFMKRCRPVHPDLYCSSQTRRDPIEKRLTQFLILVTENAKMSGLKPSLMENLGAGASIVYIMEAVIRMSGGNVSVTQWTARALLDAYDKVIDAFQAMGPGDTLDVFFTSLSDTSVVEKRTMGDLFAQRLSEVEEKHYEWIGNVFPGAMAEHIENAVEHAATVADGLTATVVERGKELLKGGADYVEKTSAYAQATDNAAVFDAVGTGTSAIGERLGDVGSFVLDKAGDHIPGVDGFVSVASDVGGTVGDAVGGVVGNFVLKHDWTEHALTSTRDAVVSTATAAVNTGVDTLETGARMALDLGSDAVLETTQIAAHATVDVREAIMRNPFTWVRDNIPDDWDGVDHVMAICEMVFGWLINPLAIVTAGYTLFRMVMTMYIRYAFSRSVFKQQHALTYETFISLLEHDTIRNILSARNLGYMFDTLQLNMMEQIRYKKIPVYYTRLTRIYYKESNMKCHKHSRKDCDECNKTELSTVEAAYILRERLQHKLGVLRVLER